MSTTTAPAPAQEDPVMTLHGLAETIPLCPRHRDGGVCRTRLVSFPGDANGIGFHCPACRHTVDRGDVFDAECAHCGRTGCVPFVTTEATLCPRLDATPMVS